jgi:trypsin
MMLPRSLSLGAAVLCAIALIGLNAGAATAKGARAHTSVIGGAPASLSEWGFTASVLTTNTLCSGSVISPTKVLTAAHCVANPPTMTVRTNSTSAFGGGEAHSVASAAINPAWTHGFLGDLAVLTLRTPTSAPAIQLASASEDAALTGPGAALSVAGFGSRNPAPTRKQKIGLLMTANVFVHGFCPVPTSLLCDAGGKSGLIAIIKIKRKIRKRGIQRTVCAGDSGGPMVATTPAGPRLVGVAEATAAPPKRAPFGFVWCGLKGYPGLHTRVASWLGFIQGS